MSTNWASENLQVIRTLMERSALYRRALAPLMVVAGVCGLATAIFSHLAGCRTLSEFVVWWTVACVIAQGACLLLVRRQALKASESFWTLPCRQVTRAVLPGFCSGALISLVSWEAPEGVMPPLLTAILWACCHACSLHAAGAFMKRGIRLFAWLVLAAAVSAGGLFSLQPSYGTMDAAILFMGLVFGLLHLVFGLYLYSSERATKAS